MNGTVVDSVQVPSSLRPSGFYNLRRDVPLPKLRAGQRAILHFDAITYYGRARVNGTELGDDVSLTYPLNSTLPPRCGKGQMSSKWR